MPCVHLQQLFELCDREGLRLSSADLIHIVCHQCNRQEVCPSTLSEFIPEDELKASAPALRSPTDDKSA